MSEMSRRATCTQCLGFGFGVYGELTFVHPGRDGRRAFPVLAPLTGDAEEVKPLAAVCVECGGGSESVEPGEVLEVPDQAPEADPLRASHEAFRERVRQRNARGV